MKILMISDVYFPRINGVSTSIVPEDKEADFARNIVKMLNEPALRACLGAEGRAYAAEWNAGALVRRLADAYQEVRGAGGGVLPELDERAGNAWPARVAIR